MGGLSYNPDSEIPNLAGKVILVTGGTAGIGEQTALQLAKHGPAHIYISGRNAASANTIIEGIAKAGSQTRVSFLKCDLASLHSVREAAELLLAQETRLDILICNAGIMAVPPGLTADGYEVQFGTNHLGHALLIQKLLPLIQTSSDPRIVILTSLGFRLHPTGGVVFKDVMTTQDFGAFGSWIRYGQSKIANLLYARELSKRYPAITSVAIHPGVVNTSLVGSLSRANRAFVWVSNFGKLLKPAEGAYNQLWAATASKAKIQNGQLYEPVAVLSNRHDKTSQDDELAAKLWDWTDEALKDFY
ncbi:hypothetical protein BDW59DRAFT_142139 [Aspergillus cavernicola]|uniref:Oxidoreductase n=1 Tax=Aspergillus cavernicola TaxID=176166 RepID=A0ABR4IRE6_9EURO